ncbi:MAG: twin-arginine translocation signal domain-containing protein [Rubrobacter sp.]|nr:twin-arginine translocation signal domain-containing protein [Rubrobacter sp.]
MKAIEVPGFTLPGIEDITRRDFLVGGAAALLLAGCGGSDGDSSSGETREVRSGEGSIETRRMPSESWRRIIEKGRHGDLVNGDGLCRKLHDRQFGGTVA